MHLACLCGFPCTSFWVHYAHIHLLTILKPEGRCVFSHLHPQGKFVLSEWGWDTCLDNMEKRKANRMLFFSWLLIINNYLRLNFSLPLCISPWATIDFGIQSEIGNCINTSTSGIKYNLYAGNSEILKLQLQIPSAQWTSLSEGLRLSTYCIDLSRLLCCIGG